MTIACAATLRDVGGGAQSLSAPVTALEVFLGSWTYEGDGNGGRVSCRSERRWIANQSFVESHRECTTPNGPVTQVEVYGYDARRRLYLYWGFNGVVVSTYTSPSVVPAAVWTGEGHSAGNRCTERFASDGNSSRAQCETSQDGGTTWQRVSGGVSTKTR